MILLSENTSHVLPHVPNYGAGKYHVRIPGTRDLQSGGGYHKVSRTIDGHVLDSINIAPRKGGDKLIAIKKPSGTQQANVTEMSLL